MKTKGVFILALLYLVWPLYQVTDYILGQPMSGPLDNLNYAASILAFDWLLLNVLLGLKIPAFQKHLPYDFRIRAHIITSSLVMAFLVWHAVYYLFIVDKQISLVTWVLLSLVAGFALFSVLWIPLPGFTKFRQVVTAALKFGFLKSYDALKAVHKVLFVALAGVTYWHVLDAKLIGVASPASSFGFEFLFFVTVAAFAWTRIQNLTLPTLEVLSISRHGDTTRLALAGHPRVKYQAGQFAFLRFQSPALKDEEHPFSFISAGHEPVVEFAVRGLGDFTTRLSTLKPGDKVKINPGFGAFRPSKGTKPLVLMGTGIGSVPLVSIAKDLAVTQPDRRVECFVAAPSRGHIVDLDRLEALAAERPTFRLHVLARDEGSPRLDEAFLASTLASPRDYDYYLCASDKVRIGLVDTLGRLGVRRRNVHYEAFGLG
jgi:predicted ferric reductase